FSLQLARTPSSSLFPYTTLFRSQLIQQLSARVRDLESRAAQGTPLAAGKRSATAAAAAAPLTAAAAQPGAPAATQPGWAAAAVRSEEHTSELQSRRDLVCRLLLE